MENFYIQELQNYNVKDELQNIGFDSLYLEHALAKYESKTLKFYSLKSIEANILKQTALSAGTDCAVHKNVILNAEGLYNCIICTTKANFLKIAEKLKSQQFRLKDIAKEIENVFTEHKNILYINERVFDFNNNKYIMGILNITPDSFSDGGKYFDEKSAATQYKNLINEGADIIDIGAQSTRPDYKEVSPEEEIIRLKKILNNSEIITDKTPKSIDTYNYKVAEYALKNGVNIINDVHGFSDINMIKLAKDAQCPVIVMFNQKHLPESDIDTFSQMYDFFVRKLDELISEGIDFKNIIIDCGFGFLKNNIQNINMLDYLCNLKNLKCPVLLGISRKSFLNYIDKEEDKDLLSLLITAKYINNFSIIRTHSVKNYNCLKKL